MKERTHEIRSYILNELEFLIKYFGDNGPAMSTLIYWNDLSKEKSKSEISTKLTRISQIDSMLSPAERRRKLAECHMEWRVDQLNNSGRWDFNDVIKLQNIFGEIVDLLITYKAWFQYDINHFENFLNHRDMAEGEYSEIMLRLTLWSSVLSNDLSGELSPLGPYCADITKDMNHQNIGILDALHQMLWNPLWNNVKNLVNENIWKADLIRSQILLNVVYKKFVLFLLESNVDEPNKKDESGKIKLKNSVSFEEILIQWAEQIGKASISKSYFELKKQYGIVQDEHAIEDDHDSSEFYELEGKKFIRDVTRKLDQLIRNEESEIKSRIESELRDKWNYSIRGHKTTTLSGLDSDLTGMDKIELESKLQDILNEGFANEIKSTLYLQRKEIFMELKKFLLPPSPYRWNEDLEELSRVLAERINNKVGKFNQENSMWWSNIKNELFNITFFKSDIKHPPLVMLIDGSTSAWAGDKEVPSIIVVNRNRAQSKNMATRLLAYAAIPHEVGHDISDSFRSDILIRTLKVKIEENDEIRFKDIWKAWINEMVADATGVALLGAASIIGLIRAIENAKMEKHVIRSDSSGIQYDPHPNSIIRVLMSLRVLLEMEGEKQYSELEDAVTPFYYQSFGILNIETLYNEVTGNEHFPIEDLQNEINVIVEIMLKTTHVCLKNRSLFDLFYTIKNDKKFSGLSKNFDELLDTQLLEYVNNTQTS